MPETIVINWIAVLVAAVSTFVVGGVWYAPPVFGKAWMRESGFTKESLARMGGTARIFGGAFVLALVMAANLAAFVGPKATLGFGLFAGAAAGIGWVAAAYGVTYLFEHRSLKSFLINAGYHAVTMTLMGGIIGAWGAGAK